MRRRAFNYVEFAIVLALLFILPSAYFLLTFNRHPRPSRRSVCQSNLKQIGLGFMQYAQNAGEKYPPNRAGWGNEVQPYLKTWRVFHCPSASPQSEEKTTDYFANARLSGVEMNKVEDRSLTIFAGEGLAAQPLNYSLSQLPASWLKVKDADSPAHRHTERSNYLFADGHVKPLKPEEVTILSPLKGEPTFEVKP